MRTQPVDTRISFGYSHPLKTLFLKGKLLTVQYGIYGDKLTKDTVSLEHVQPKSKGGKSVLSNYALASKRMNNLRGNKDIREFLTPENLKSYCEQFIGVIVGDFDGTKYIHDLLKTINRLLNK